MSYAFELRPDCPVPSIPAIEGSLVSSCSLKPVPDVIYEFPIFDVPLNMPTSFDFGCYCLPSIDAILSSNMPTPSFRMWTVKDPEKGCCAPSIFMQMDTAAGGCTAPTMIGTAEFEEPSK